MPARTKGCVLLDDAVSRFFDEAIPLSTCTPQDLFRYESASKWQDIRKWSSALSALLDVSQGRIPTQRRWHAQLRKWLEKSEKSWSYADSERASYGVRQMLQCLLVRKRDHGAAPKRYSGLNVLIAKLHLDCEGCGEDKDIAGISADESSVDLEDAEPRQYQVVAVEGVSSASDVEIVSSTCAIPVTMDSLAALENSLFGDDADDHALVTPVKSRKRLWKKGMDLTPKKIFADLDIDAMVDASLNTTPPLPADFARFQKEKT